MTKDAFLLQAFDLADQTVTRLKKEAEDSRWTVVAQKLKILKKNALYSVRACRERYEALQNGTATLPAVDSENLEQQTNEQNNGETNAERMDVDLVAPSGSVTRKDTRRRSGAPLVADEDEIISDGSSDLSDTEPTVNQHLSNLIKSGIDLSAITNLPFKAQVMSASIGRKAPDLGKNLKAVEDMNRDELREELRMRGLCSDGLRPKMAETLKAARAGNTDLKHSPKNAMNLSFRRPAKPVKKSAARRLSTILLSDAEKSGDEEDRDHKEGPKQKRAKTGSSSTAAADKQPVEDSSKAVVNEQPAPATMTNTEHLAPLINTEQLAPLINTEQFAPVSTKSTQQSAPVATTNNQAFQGPTLADEIFGLLYLPLAETNLQLVYQKEIEDGRRLFLSNVPPSFNADMIRTILNAYSLKAVHTLRATGNLVVDCADVETAVGVTSALDGLALKGQVIVVENAQVIAQKYFAARNQAPSTEAPSTQASTPVVGSVNNTPRPKMLTKKDSKSPSKIMCQLVVKNVPDSVDAMQLQQVFGKLQACEHIESGVWLMEFSDASSAERCYKTSQGQRVRGEILELDYYLPEASKVIRRRATKQEADMYDDAL
ncbi:hypothetical protein MMC30_008211 [Trapelia coarctata]|nr:hypothetical protein [Trapelia coarctata]